MNAKILAIHGLHDSSFTFVDKNNQIRIFEYERFCKKRYAPFTQEYTEYDDVCSNSLEIKNNFLNYIKIQLKEEIEIILHSDLKPFDIEFLKKHFPNSKFVQMGHHISHCFGAYFQSGFESALCISLDGGGFDYQTEYDLGLRSYSIYKFQEKKVETIIHTNMDIPDKISFNPGIYGSLGYYINEIKKDKKLDGKSIKNSLSYAGKVMGLAAYGEVRNEWVLPIENFYGYDPKEHWTNFDLIEEKLSEELGIELFENCFSEKDGYDFAATNQYVFEKLCFSFIKSYIDEYNLDVVFSGGCALNVLFNQKLSEYLAQKSLKLYIPPHPGDCGLSYGHFVSFQEMESSAQKMGQFNSPYCGIDIMDRDNITFYYKKYNNDGKVKISSVFDIVDLIKNGKIGGIIQGYSEVGPRALGNRSIICDPSIADMKDIINSKVKFREWFRPFAPVCREVDKNIYFENAFPSEYMSFSPKVREKYRDLLPSITHEDGTARLQTVTRDQHCLFYDILTELKNRNEISVIMNTSFNIKGKPILTTLEDAFDVLENTELDFLIVENLLFLK